MYDIDEETALIFMSSESMYVKHFVIKTMKAMKEEIKSLKQIVRESISHTKSFHERIKESQADGKNYYSRINKWINEYIGVKKKEDSSVDELELRAELENKYVKWLKNNNGKLKGAKDYIEGDKI